MQDNLYISKKYVRNLPTKFCEGCGNGQILNAFARAVDNLKLDKKKIVCVSGIGCSSWIPSPYFKSDALHVTHGRAMAFATGVKLFNPNLCVVVFTGDGDGAGIGGNHLIHAARRNLDIKVILVNNQIYGMTGGQLAPTTPINSVTETTPEGNRERPFDLFELMKAAGAKYVARTTTYHSLNMIKKIEKALSFKGFCFVEIISQCPTYFGRKNKMTALDLLHSFKKIKPKEWFHD